MNSATSYVRFLGKILNRWQHRLDGVNLKEIVRRMRKHFDAQEELREQVLDFSRQVIRASARAIAAVHRGDKAAARKALAKARVALGELTKAIKSDPIWLRSSIVQSAQQEYCEAKLFQGLLERGKILGPEELKIPYQPYLAALADAGGELRRHALNSIRADEVARAEWLLERIEDIHELLMEFDYPDAILPGMKRKQDMVRGVLEKTRGDLTVALRQQRLEKALERARRAR